MTKTEENLKAAFAGESQARNKYTYFAEKAKEEGLHFIAKIFEETADNEREHAKKHFTMLKGIGDTKANLKAAMEGEDHETKSMYPDFAKEAEEDGDKAAAVSFKMIGKIEEQHRNRYKKLLEMLENGTFFKRDKPIRWKCSVCGFIHEGTSPPGICPGCGKPQGFYGPECFCLCEGEDGCTCGCGCN
ncbi:MAG: rubrerythrin [archaeon]